MINTISTNVSRQKQIDKNSTIFHLSDLDWADIKVVCEIVLAFKLVQETLEGEIYITGSRVVAILDKIRADLILTRLEWADSEKGTRVLTSVIEVSRQGLAMVQTCARWIAKALLANLVATPR